MPKVLISDKLSAAAVQVFENRGIEVVNAPGLSAEALLDKIAEFDGLAVRSATKVSSDVLAKALKLKVVGRAGIGVDNIDVKAATARGVVVMNTPFGNTITTAEHAIAMMFALARQLPSADRSTKAGKWEKNRFMGVELYGKTLGVIGIGNIGSIVADRAQGLKMRVIAYDPFLSDERARDLGVEKVELEALLGRADFITLHVPLTDQTRNILSAEAIAKTKRGVRIINCARGGLVDEGALKAAIDSGHVAGAALDVFLTEPAKDSPLFALDESFVATPHLGASTEEAQENVAVQVAEQMSDYLLSGAVINALNMPSVSAEDAPRLKPYMTLAEQLGSFAGQLTETGVRAITIEYEGHVAGLNVKPLTGAALTGLLKPILDTVNMVSAPTLVKERDIELREVRNEVAEGYQTLIRITITTDRQTRSVTGTLIGDGKPRIVNIKGIAIEAELSPHMLYTTNDDKPGVIGGIATALGGSGLNIATFHLGRSAEGDAIALVSLDEMIPDAVLEKIRAVPHVTQAKRLEF